MVSKIRYIFLALSGMMIFITAFSVPGGAGIDGTNLDASYPLVLEDASARGAVYGTDIIYTHGPLGHLFHQQGLGGFKTQRLFYAILQAAFAAYVSCAVLARLPLPVAMALSAWLIVYPPTLTLLGAGVAVILLQPPPLPWLKRAESYILPSIYGLCGMAKFTEIMSGIVVFGGVTAVWAYRRRLRDGVLPMAVFLTISLGAWLAMGQPLDRLPAYFTRVLCS